MKDNGAAGYLVEYINQVRNQMNNTFSPTLVVINQERLALFQTLFLQI
jgi:hypothetical protein